MITFLAGKLVVKQPTRIVLDVRDVGYEVFIPLSSYDRLPPTGEPCRVLTVDYVREDTHQLFGFLTEEERRLFNLLMGTTGIGPKLALSALSGLSVRDLKQAIGSGDVRRLSSISGVGKKVAERIVVELRDKIGESGTYSAADESHAEGSLTRDAVLALVTLGYKEESARGMIARVLKRPDAPRDLETLIKRTLAQ
jgi:Holliday junction DNA helicase RuvA